MRAPGLEMVELALEGAKNAPRAIGRDVIDRMDAIAELRDVSDHAFDEHVLVVDENDSDDLRWG